jgi:hypothetical protein
MQALSEADAAVRIRGSSETRPGGFRETGFEILRGPNGEIANAPFIPGQWQLPMRTEVMSEYSNGPLPPELERHAYFTTDRREWALPRKQALSYLIRCQQNNVEVFGWEAWYPTTFGPTIVGSTYSKVGADLNYDSLMSEPDADIHGPIVYNITARGRS